MIANTLFLRLEGPMQAWGNQESKFVIRRTSEAPTKSGIVGMLCAALGIPRAEAPNTWLPRLRDLQMGVRIDEPGIRWWDYHTVGAKLRMRTAEGGYKRDALLTRREYLCDASFLVALRGEAELISELLAAMERPRWTLYLGRKACPPSRPILVHPAGDFPDVLTALKSLPWSRRLRGDTAPQSVDCLIDWCPTPNETEAPDDALVCYDVPLSFDPPSHDARFVVRKSLEVGSGAMLQIADGPTQHDPPFPLRSRADYKNTEYRKARAARLDADYSLCVFCKTRATTVQHITYRRAGGDETQEDLRSLCRLCHDAVTMIEYGLGMGMDRINPEDGVWRDLIIEKREEIIKFRSLETRRRKLEAKEVE